MRLMARSRHIKHERFCRLACGAAAVALAGACLAAVSTTAAAAGAEHGRELAQRYCSRCHVVSRDNNFSGISSTPSFMMLVNALADWEERFQTFYARRPHPVHVRVKGIAPLTKLPPNATPFDIELADVEAILAYVSGLKTK